MIEENIDMEKANNNSDKIDIISIIKILLKKKRTFAVTSAIGLIVGVIIAFSLPKTYKTEVILAPEINSSNGLSGNLSDLASMVGVNLNSNNVGSGVDAIYPELYPQIINSTPFLTSMFNVHVNSDDNSIKNVTLYQYLESYQKMPWWTKIIIGIKGLFTSRKLSNNISKINDFKLTIEQDGIAQQIRRMIQCNVDKKTSIITISVIAQNAVISAALADTVQSKMQQYITEYRTKKARKDLAYAQKLYDEAKTQYVRSQEQYGSYSDANTDVVLQSFKSKQDEMENEMQLRYNIYTQCVQQLQIAKAKVQERTPAFTEIQPATVPNKKDGPKRMTIIFGFIMFAVVLTIFYVLITNTKGSES
jgi:uncharacterized protein involved in exopolysaccharide biosynthesis